MGSSTATNGEKTKVLKFRKLEAEDDVEAYFCVFEAHMDSYSVNQTHWNNKHLAPIVLMPLKYTQPWSDDWKCYESLKEAFFRITTLAKKCTVTRWTNYRRNRVKFGQSVENGIIVRKWMAGQGRI